VGVDPWDVDLRGTLAVVVHLEQRPVSRYWWGSPCRYVRAIDLAIHVILPQMLEEKYPHLAHYLRSTSPRWGRTYRGWGPAAPEFNTVRDFPKEIKEIA
jgi:hypothetical protein